MSVILEIDTCDDARTLLGAFISYCKAQYRLEKSRFDCGARKKVKYCDDNGDPIFPFIVNVKTINEKGEFDKCKLDYDFNLNKLKSISTKNESDYKKTEYIPIKDRIPGEIYNGNVWYPRMRNKIIADKIKEVYPPKKVNQVKDQYKKAKIYIHGSKK